MIGALAALGSSVTWALGTQIYPELSRRYSPFEVNGSRALVALPLFFALSLGVSGPEGWAGVDSGHLGWFVLSMVSSYFLGDACFLWSTEALGVPGALAIASSYPVWTALASWFFKGEPPSLQQSVGIGLAVAGTLLVILAGSRLKSGYGRGVMFGLLTSGFWGLNGWAVAEGAKGLSPWVGNSIRMVIALVLCGVASSVIRKRPRLGIPFPVLSPHLPLFAFEAFGGSWLFLYGLTHASLPVASALSSLAPVLAVPLAWLRRSEPLSNAKAAGVGLAVLGVIVLVTGS